MVKAVVMGADEVVLFDGQGTSMTLSRIILVTCHPQTISGDMWMVGALVIQPTSSIQSTTTSAHISGFITFDQLHFSLLKNRHWPFFCLGL